MSSISITAPCRTSKPVRERERAQHHGIHYAENRCIRADSESQRKTGGNRKSRRVAQRARGQPKIAR
jgi:hypothetical protein